MTRGHFFYSWTASGPGSWLAWISGVCIVLAYFFISVFLTRWTDWGRKLDTMFSRVLTPLSYFQIIVISLLSGLVEEWLFRGVLLSHFGLVLSSFLFGLCHLIPQPKLWVWSFWSFAMGILLGLVMQLSGSLWLCASIHAGVNALLILYLNLRAYQEPQMET